MTILSVLRLYIFLWYVTFSHILCAEVITTQKENTQWVLCPICNSKTRIMLRKDTELKKFPLFCPKCKNETLINAKQFKIEVIKEPDAKTQEPY